VILKKIEKKISIISTISNYANEKRNLVNLHVYASQTVKKKCMKPVMVLFNNGLSVYKSLKIYNVKLKIYIMFIKFQAFNATAW
jgi:hypothetical protein